LAFYFGMDDNYPLLVAANRDEHYDRPSAAPQVLQGPPKILAGRDLRVGGTWLGVNEYGLVVGILNRRLNDIEPTRTNARSRGLLCMDLLALKSARDGRDFVAAHDQQYNPFTVMFADRDAAFVAYNVGPELITRPLARGLHVFSSAAEVDLHSIKADRAREKFARALVGQDADHFRTADWIAPLQLVLSDHSLDNGSADPGDAICVHRDSSGTVSSSVIAYSLSASRFEMFHCAGPPCKNPFADALILEVR
jgi:uncharacterized protein with NRDE domain